MMVTATFESHAKKGLVSAIRQREGAELWAGPLHLLDLDERVVAVLEEVAHFLGVHLDHAQQQLAGQPQRQRRLRVDDGVCSA